jgi:hypothetical protein
MLVVPVGDSLSHNVSLDSSSIASVDEDRSLGSYDALASQWNFPHVDSHYFTQNLGQWEDHIIYLAETSFGYAALADDGVYYYMVLGGEGHTIKITFQGAKATCPDGQEDNGFYSNYFYGNDPAKWVVRARSFNEVLYEEVWPGIDILYYFKNGKLKYDILVGEYASPSDISFYIEGHGDLDVIDNSLEISISEDVMISDTDLVAFYSDGTNVPVQFQKTGDNTFGFLVNKIYGKVLTIDPVVFTNSTYIGGAWSEEAKDVAMDSNNNIVILGWTSSVDFPNTTGAFQTSLAGGSDIIVTKMNENASEIIFSTYIGDWSSDYGHGLELDENDDIYVTGGTYSWYFPTTNGSFQEEDPSPSYPDAFVLKLAAAGDELLYSTYVGGTGSDEAKDIKVLNRMAYVTGNALSYDFPSTGPQAMDPHGTVFFFVLNEDGSNLADTMFWGGWSNEFGYSLSIDAYGDAIIGGVTYSADFPTTPGAYQTMTNDTANGFIIKYRPFFGMTIFSSYIGGNGSDNVLSVFVDDSDHIYMTGVTNKPSQGPDFPTTDGAFDRTYNGYKDAFITKMDNDGTMLIYSTLIGGEGEEKPGRIFVDGTGKVYLTGKIDSDLNYSLTPDCFDDTLDGDNDAFLLILNHDGSDLVYSTLLGGSATDSGTVCVLDSDNRIVIAGSTGSEDYPVTSGSFQTANSEYGDIFLTIFKSGNIMYLHEGWNFISIPLIQMDTNLNSVLAPINGYYDAVQWYDPTDLVDHWKHHHISKPSSTNDLKDLDHIKGFWIHITTPQGVLFEYTGMPFMTPERIPLQQGWNMVSFPSISNHDRASGLNNLVFGSDVDAIQWYDAESKAWKSMDSDDGFSPGRGYWIHSKVDAQWEVPL